jgi:hypothetical protein
METNPLYVNFGLGLNTKDAPKNLKDGECSIAQDCNFDKEGSIRSRFWKETHLSFTSPPTVIFPYNNLFVSLLNGDTYDGSTLIESALTSDYVRGAFSCVEYNNILYFVSRSDQQDIQKRYDKTNLHNIGNTGPAAAPTVADEGSAGNPDGTYNYKYTYVDSNGKESSASPVSADISVTTNRINVTVVASTDSKVSSINIYRLGGTLSAWYQVVSGEANTDHTYIDDIADSALSTLFDADGNDPPPNLQYITEHFERIVGSRTGTNPNSTWFTREYEPEYWGDGTDNQYLLGGIDENTGILSWGRVIVYFKRGQIYVLEGTDPASWFRRRSNSSKGNIAPYAIDFWKLPIFCAYDGLHTFDGDLESKFSEKVNPFFSGDHKDHLVDAVGAVFDDKYYFSCDGETLVYDLLYDRFYTYNFEMTAISNDKVNHILYAGVGNNVVKLEQDSNDNSESVDFQIKSKAYPLNEIVNVYGQLLRYYMNINTNGEDVTFNIYIDETLVQSDTINTTSMTQVEDTIDDTYGMYAEFEFTYSGTKQIEIETPITINA